MTAKEFEKPLVLGDSSFLPGERGSAQIPVGHLITHEMIDLTVQVRRGEKPGPRLLVTAALHGDEINGVEIIRRILRRKMSKLVGDLIAIPIVNLPAFLNRSRYLPDRRDLNRLFPGSSSGSFGARLARIITSQVASQCTHAIDLHTGAINRPNLPQIRFSGATPGAREMAEAFVAPVMIDSSIRSGSFREVFSKKNKPQILFEAGEAEILEPTPVKIGMQGVQSVMRHLGMLPSDRPLPSRPESVFCTDTYWERAPRGGLFLPSVDLGAIIKKGSILGKVGDPFGPKKNTVRAQTDGVIIGRARNAVVDEGDGIFHIGMTKNLESMAENLEATEAELDHRMDHPVFDDPLED